MNDEARDARGAFRLWVHVLCQARMDLEARTGGRRAEAWFKSESTEAGSITWVCGQLGLDVAEVRQKAKKVRR